MLTSAQVAALMQQQNSMFTGMQQYAQGGQVQAPQPYGGIGSYGMQGPVAPQFAQVPYAPRQQAGFSYGGNPFGYGMGNQMGAAGVSALGSGGQAVLGGLGIAGGLGLLPRGMNMAFDPISAGMSAFRFAGGGAMGLGAGALAAGAVAAPVMMAQHALGSMVTGAQEQAGVNQAMGQFNFINPMSRSGRGFSRQDSMAIGSMMRELQSIPEMMTSMSELTRILDKMGQSGMMQGTRDASEFGKKFKETIHTLKDISKMMGSTMEEAFQAFQESKQSGFYTPDSIRQNIMQRQIVGGLTGMNQQQVGALQAYGAQSSFAAGGSRAGGARGITRIAGELGMANQMGLLSNERLMELTGEEGAAGIQQLAGTMNDVGQRMGRSSLGTAMTLALGEVKEGRYTGNMDQELVQRVRNGQIGKDELLKLAHEKSRTRTAKLSFSAHRQRLTTEMVNNAGAQGIAMELSTILGERGFDNPDALNLVMQRYGVGEREANQVIEMMKEMPTIQRGMGEAGTAESRRMAEQAFMRENASFEGIKKKLGKKMENLLTEPFKKMGASLANSISESVDDFVDDLFGRYKTTVTQMANDTAIHAAMGSKKAQALVSSSAADIRANRMAGVDLRNTSLVGGALNYISGQQTTGDIQASILKGMGRDYYERVSGDEERIKKGGGLILEGGYFDKDFTVSTPAARARASRALQGENRLSGKIDISKGPAKMLASELRNQLLSNEELQNPELTDQQKFDMLQKSLNSAGMWQGRAEGEAMDALKKQLGSDSSIDIIDALAKAGGLENQIGMFSRRGLAGGLRGAGSEKALADRIKKEVNTAAEGFGDKSDLARTVFEQGGATAKILSAAFGGDKMGAAVQQALGDREGTAVKQEVLDALRLTQKEFDASRGQGRELLAAGRQHGASGQSIKDLLGSQLSMAVLKQEQRGKEIGEGLTTRLSEADLGSLSEGGRGVAARLGALAGRLNKGEGLGDDLGDLVESLANSSGKERTRLMGLAGSELAGGAQEILDARLRYKRAKGGKGGKSLEALGYTSEALSRLGISGEDVTQIQAMAGEDKMVTPEEEKKIEKYMGELRTRSLASSKGTEQNAVNASKGLQDYFEKQSKNQERITTLLEGLINKQSGGK